MPKPSFPNKQSWVKDGGSWNSQDDFHRHKDTKRVTFKSNKHNFKKNNKDWGASLKEYFTEEDVDMGLTSGSSHGFKKRFDRNNRKRGGGSGPSNGKRPLLEGPTGWYKVQVIILF